MFLCFSVSYYATAHKAIFFSPSFAAVERMLRFLLAGAWTNSQNQIAQAAGLRNIRRSPQSPLKSTATE